MIHPVEFRYVQHIHVVYSLLASTDVHHICRLKMIDMSQAFKNYVK